MCSCERHAHHPPTRTGTAPRPVFEQIDTHRTGDISAEEVAAVFAKLGGDGAAISPAEAQELIRQYDENGEGTLNFQEFAKMMSQESLHSVG